MRKVSVFIVGQPKSGTTALVNFLDQHPELCVSIPKEPSFFCTDIHKESDGHHTKITYFHIRELKEYNQLFSHCDKNSKLLEASTNGLWSKTAAKNIYEYNPGAKIIIMLRNPVDFMASLHKQYVNETKENITDFETALNIEESRVMGNNLPSRINAPSYLFYSKRAQYYDQVKRYIDIFGKENVLIIPMEKFQQNNSKWYKKAVKFIGVNDLDFKPKFSRVNDSKAPRSILVNKIMNSPALKNILRLNLGRKFYQIIRNAISPIMYKHEPRKPINNNLRKKIYTTLRSDIKQLSELVEYDFENLWLSEAQEID